MLNPQGFPVEKPPSAGFAARLERFDFGLQSLDVVGLIAHQLAQRFEIIAFDEIHIGGDPLHLRSDHGFDFTPYAVCHAGCVVHQTPEIIENLFALGHMFNLLWAGREIEAEALLDRATLLSPRDSHLWSFHHVRAWAHFSLGELDLAAEFARRAIRQPNVTYRAFATLTASLGNLGNTPEAAAAASELMQRKPGYTGEFARQEFFFCNDPSFVDRFVTGLGNAGIPAS